MSLFVEVESVEKQCKVILNLDEVVEVAPLREGGCLITLSDLRLLKVRDDYSLFKQFAMQTVTADDIAKRFPRDSVAKHDPKAVKTKTAEAVDIPKL